MITIRSLTCLLIVAMQSFSFSQWIPLDKNSTPNSQPIVQLLSDDDFSTVIKVDLSGFQINEFISNGKTYHSINIFSDGITTEVGYPEIAHIAKILAIP